MKEASIQIYLKLAIAALVVWLFVQLAERWNFQVDMTEEKRYTISQPTKELLRSLESEVFFEVYLEGELPPNFERFKTSIRTMLEQFSLESGNSVQFKFTDPSQAGSAQARNEFYQSLMQQGLQPTQLSYTSDGDNLQKLIFPSALASQGVNEIAVNLLKGNRTANPEEILNQSIEGLEYELASSIAQLAGGGAKKIGFITGHGAPGNEELAGLNNAILNKYLLFDLDLNGKKELLGYDAIIIGKPREAFKEAEKYLLDQYLMKGGNLLFFVDALRVNIDSALGDGTVAIPYETNLTDQLFKYGVRINNDLVMDLNSGQLPIVSGNMGNQPQIRMVPWPFFPMISDYGKHPAVRNLDATLTRFTSTIDTVKAKGIKKTPLLKTSPYTKVLGPPVRVAMNDLQFQFSEDQFNEGSQVVGYMLEGHFSSLYANRLVPRGFDKGKFLEKGIEYGKVLIIADGDMIINEFDPESGEPLALGVEAFTRTTYANEQLVMNLLDYMVDDTELITARSREVRIRPLDKVKVNAERTYWQVLNLGVPVLLILLFGIAKWYLRKRKFA